MDAVSINFAPATGTDDEWNEAYARLADYYRSFRLHNRLRRTQLILETLQRAAKAHAIDPTRKPTQHSIEQARLMMHDWLGKIYNDMQMTGPSIYTPQPKRESPEPAWKGFDDFKGHVHPRQPTWKG